MRVRHRKALRGAATPGLALLLFGCGEGEPAFLTAATT